MLIRFVVNNLLSFGEEREFNMIPYSQLKGRLPHHAYPITENFSLLKMAAVYGANGAGKSNLVKSLLGLQQIVLGEITSTELHFVKFRLDENLQNKSQILGVEFISMEKPYIYAIEVNEGIIITEELYLSGLGKRENQLIFERKTTPKGKTHLQFFADFEANEKNRVLKEVLQETLIKPEKSAFKLLANLENDYLKEIKQAFHWFEESLRIIQPQSKPVGMIVGLNRDNTFQKFASKNLHSYNTGINNIFTKKIPLSKFINLNTPDFVKKIKETLVKPGREVIPFILDNTGEEILVSNKNGEIIVERIVLEHLSKQGKPFHFYRNQESDGINRLLDYLPILRAVLEQEKVFIIDEIERSLHPLLIKEILQKFSNEKNSKGQLIFTTHESNLLDQTIFRPDEIWFMEKDKWGCSDMYALSEFKEHKTKDIRKGYLNGRYGAIPFLGNLRDLNWSEYATIE